MEVVKNGAVVASFRVPAADARLSHVLTLESGQWAHVRLRDERGLTAFSNPVYMR